jgi:hypothetical protein
MLGTSYMNGEHLIIGEIISPSIPSTAISAPLLELVPLNVADVFDNNASVLSLGTFKQLQHRPINMLVKHQHLLDYPVARLSMTMT